MFLQDADADLKELEDEIATEATAQLKISPAAEKERAAEKEAPASSEKAKVLVAE